MVELDNYLAINRSTPHVVFQPRYAPSPTVMSTTWLDPQPSHTFRKCLVWVRESVLLRFFREELIDLQTVKNKLFERQQCFLRFRSPDGLERHKFTALAVLYV